jgi:hypothetical protein
MAWNWLCNECSPTATNYRFSVIAGTIFENTNKPLRDWFRVIHLMLTSKKGISALQIQRTLGFGSYHTAHYMCHRVRAGLIDKDFQKLMTMTTGTLARKPASTGIKPRLPLSALSSGRAKWSLACWIS